MKQKWWRTFTAGLGLTACFGLFQNFSLENEYHDIRAFAPAGAPQEPASGFFAGPTRATSLNGLGNEFLRHNFQDELRYLENRVEDWSGIELGSSRRPATAVGVSAPPVEERAYRLRTGHLGKDRLGIRFEGDVDVKCEYSAFKNDVLVSVDKSLGRNANLSFRHTTEDRNSSLNFIYAW